MCRISCRFIITMLTWYGVSWQVASFPFMKDSNMLAFGNLSKLLLSICSHFCCLHKLKWHAVRNAMRPGQQAFNFPMFLHIMTNPISGKLCHSKVSWNYGKVMLQHLPNDVDCDLTELLRWSIFKLSVITRQSCHGAFKALWHSIERRVEIIGRYAVDYINLTENSLKLLSGPFGFYVGRIRDVCNNLGSSNLLSILEAPVFQFRIGQFGTLKFSSFPWLETPHPAVPAGRSSCLSF